VAGRLAALDGAGHLDRTAEQQQFFRQRGLTRVRVGDDGEGASLGELFLQLGHGITKPIKKARHYTSHGAGLGRR
jgi:hypothetical protein